MPATCSPLSWSRGSPPPCIRWTYRTSLPPAPTPAALEPLPLDRLAGDLLPLFAAALRLEDAFPACDALEAQTLLAWLQTTGHARGVPGNGGGTAGRLCAAPARPGPPVAAQRRRTPLVGQGLSRLAQRHEHDRRAAAGGRSSPRLARARHRPASLRVMRFTPAQQAGWRTLTCGRSSGRTLRQRHFWHAKAPAPSNAT